jgi:hypothetical protein
MDGRRSSRARCRLYVPSGPNGESLAHHSVEQPFIFHVLSETPEEKKEDGGHYSIAADEVPFSTQLVRAWAAMAASGNPNAKGAGLSWPELRTSVNGSALLIEGGRGTPASFSSAADFSHARCDLFDTLFHEQRGNTTVMLA